MTESNDTPIQDRQTIRQWFSELETQGYSLCDRKDDEHSISVYAVNDLCIFSLSASWPGEYPGETKAYLACFASAKDGGSNDLQDGLQTRDTWDRILADIREFNQDVLDYPSVPMGVSPTLSVYPVETQRRDCTADKNALCPNNANFYMVFRPPDKGVPYTGFFCRDHWQKAVTWAADKGS